MTFATFHRAGSSALHMQLSSALYHMAQRFDDYRQFRRTVAELRDLNNAQLKDMGLNRSEMVRVAHEAVYGPSS